MGWRIGGIPTFLGDIDSGKQVRSDLEGKLSKREKDRFSIVLPFFFVDGEIGIHVIF